MVDVIKPIYSFLLEYLKILKGNVDNQYDFVATFWNTYDTIAIHDLIELNISWEEIIHFLTVGEQKIKSFLYNIQTPHANYLTEIIPLIKNVTKLEIRLHGISQENVEQIAKYCKNLKDVTLDVLPNVSCNSIANLYLCNSKLKLYNLNGHHCQQQYIYNIMGPCLMKLPCLYLLEISLRSCKMPTRILFGGLYHVNYITYLKLENHMRTPTNFPTWVIDTFEYLEEFHFNLVHSTEPFRLQPLEPNDNSINRFVSYYNPLLSDDLLQYISEKCSELSELNIGDPPFCEDLYSEPNADERFDRSVYISAQGIKHLASLEYLEVLEMYGIRNDNLAEVMRPLAKGTSLKYLALITEDENFSDVASMFLIECNQLLWFVVLGYVVDVEVELRQRIILQQNANTRKDFFQLFVEEGSFEPEKVSEFLKQDVEIVLTTCKGYCQNYIRKEYFQK